MRREACNILHPRDDHIFGSSIEVSGLGPCLLPAGHCDGHIFQARNGKYFYWDYDYTCDCCEPEDYDHCTDVDGLTVVEANKRLLQEWRE